MSIWTLIRPVFYMLIGLGLLYFSLSVHPVAEDKLKFFEGVPKEVEKSTSGKRKYVDFTVGDMHTYYSDRKPKFDAIASAVKTGTPVKIWVDLDAQEGSGRLYKMVAGDKEILSYSEFINAEKSSSNFSLFSGIALVLVSIFLFWKRFKP